MTLFRNITHQEIWIDRWCHTCFEPHEAQRRLQNADTWCPILEYALRTKRKPPQWDRNPRADEMHRAITCNAYQPKPPHVRKPPHQDFEDVPMFDVEPKPAHLIPVEGWPDPPTKDEPDHA